MPVDNSKKFQLPIAVYLVLWIVLPLFGFLEYGQGYDKSVGGWRTKSLSDVSINEYFESETNTGEFCAIGLTTEMIKCYVQPCGKVSYLESHYPINSSQQLSVDYSGTYACITENESSNSAKTGYNLIIAWLAICVAPTIIFIIGLLAQYLIKQYRIVKPLGQLEELGQNDNYDPNL
jgi:hypothetical protein